MATKEAMDPGTTDEAARTIDAAVAAIDEDIIFGRLRPRERLTEDTLMARLGVKRHVVRQALERLVRTGVVVKERNKGCAVRDYAPDEVENIYELRALLQRHAAERIPLPASSELVDRLRGIHAAHATAVDAGDLRAVYRLNNAFHDAMFEASGNPYLSQAIAHYAWIAHAIRSYNIADPTLLRQAREEHERMIGALAAGDRAELVRLCVEHINPSKEAYLAVERAREIAARADPERR